MTSHPDSRDRCTGPDPFAGTIVLDAPGAVFAALPALLGFRPDRSLLVLALGARGTSGTIDAVMRHDLSFDAAGGIDGAARGALAHFGAVCVRDGARAVIPVAVHPDLGAPGAAREAFADLAAVFEDVLAPSGVEVPAVLFAAAIGTGERWYAITGPEDDVRGDDLGGEDLRGGVQSDPRNSAVAAAHVFRGRPLRDSRRELENLLEPRPDAVAAAELARLREAARGSGGDTDAAEARYVLDTVRRHARGGVVHPGRWARAGAALTRHRVRDAMLAAIDRPGCDGFWLELARRLPGRERAEAATLVAFGAYVRGDGPLAGVALAAALDAYPGHRLAAMLDTSLHAGVRPEIVAELADVGRQVAADLGVMGDPADG
ncbi:DUF4192 domain-containing protein [Rhodococcus rhodnii]|nr:DUF4192 domain-containing protein [Rhodococcus rhodnii]